MAAARDLRRPTFDLAEVIQKWYAGGLLPHEERPHFTEAASSPRCRGAMQGSVLTRVGLVALGPLYGQPSVMSTAQVSRGTTCGRPAPPGSASSSIWMARRARGGGTGCRRRRRVGDVRPRGERHDQPGVPVGAFWARGRGRRNGGGRPGAGRHRQVIRRGAWQGTRRPEAGEIAFAWYSRRSGRIRGTRLESDRAVCGGRVDLA